MTVSDVIKPWPVAKPCPKPRNEKTWEFRDDSKTIYPEDEDGNSLRVRIAKFSAVRSDGAVFSTCKMGKRGRRTYKITYFAGNKQNVTRSTFCDELRRLGGEHLKYKLLGE